MNPLKLRKGVLVPVASLMALALVLGAATLVYALVIDSGNLNIEVPNRAGYATATTAEGATVEYIGDQNTTFGPAGSGIFDSFLRVQAGPPSEQGYNTDGKREFDTKAGNFTHSILVSDIPVVTVPGLTGEFWELFSDLNESDSTPLISLDDLEVYFTSDPKLTGYPFATTATKVYDFGGSIKINDVNQGSGRGDLRFRIPLANIQIPANCGYKDPNCATYFVLYTRFGTTGGAYTSDGGFEEWKVKRYPVKSGMKFHDLNTNGAKDAGEPGLEGWTIFADINGNGVFDAGEPMDVTDTAGNYRFAVAIAALPGTYTVREVLQANWICSFPTPDCFYVETFPAGEAEFAGNDFGNFRETNIKVTKTDSPDPVDLGADLTYTLTVENTTAVAAENVTVHDDLDSKVTFVSASPASANCVHTGGDPNGDVDCSLGTLAGGASVVITIVVNVDADTVNCGTTITNPVEVATDTPETTQDDNTDEVTTDIQCGAIRILKDSTKGDRVLVSGAIFTVTGPSPSVESFDVTDDETAAAPDEDADVGEVCVSNLVPGSYDVTEKTPPAGYSGDVDTETVTAVGGTNCSDNLPGAAGTVTFTNPPLVDIQINFRDAGSGETSITSIECIGDSNGSLMTEFDGIAAEGWDTSQTHTNLVAADTITCVLVIDP